MQGTERHLERLVLHPGFSRLMSTCEWAVIGGGVMWLFFVWATFGA